MFAKESIKKSAQNGNVNRFLQEKRSTETIADPFRQETQKTIKKASVRDTMETRQLEVSSIYGDLLGWRDPEAYVCVDIPTRGFYF